MSKPRRILLCALALLLPVVGCVLAAESHVLARAGIALPGYQLFSFGLLAFLALAYAVPAPSGGPTDVGAGQRWITAPSRWQVAGRIASPLAIISWLVFAFAGGPSAFVAILSALYGLGLVAVPAVALVERVFRGENNAPMVTLDDRTVTIRNDTAITVVLYDAIRSIERERKAVWLTTAGDRLRISVDGSEAYAEALATAIRDAKARAASPNDRRDLGGPAALLQRASGAGAREWLGAVDALAPAKDGAHAYRASGLDEETLLATLDDERADADARVAAARLLARSDDQEVKRRVASSIASVHRPELRVRIAAGMNPDLDEAAREIEAMDLEAVEREVGR